MMLQQRAVGTFSSCEATEIALYELKRRHFRMDRVSIVGQHINRRTEATLGGMAGVYLSLGSIAIPGSGSVMLAGAASPSIVISISGSIIGSFGKSLAGGLTSLGIPKTRAQSYSDQISAGHYLVILEGLNDDITLADSVLKSSGIQNWFSYDLPGDFGRYSTNSTTYYPGMPRDLVEV